MDNGGRADDVMEMKNSLEKAIADASVNACVFSIDLLNSESLFSKLVRTDKGYTRGIIKSDNDPRYSKEN